MPKTADQPIGGFLFGPANNLPALNRLPDLPIGLCCVLIIHF